MLAKTLVLAKQLISIPSTADNPQALEQALALSLAQLPHFKYQRFLSHDKPSALIYNTPSLPKRFKLILNGHLDVVQAKPEQFKPVEKGNRLYGRGADDMKAATAALIVLYGALASKLSYPLGLQLVTDEEVGGYDGVKHQIEQGITTEFFLTAETTQFKIKNEAKGVIWANIQAQGYASHGAYPWLGHNALWQLKPFLDKLQQTFPIPQKEVWTTTVNLSFINTQNQTYNKVPDEAILGFDCRYIPKDQKTILSRLKKLVPKHLKLNIVKNESFHYCRSNNPFIKALSVSYADITGRKIALSRSHGASDARHYTAVNIPGIEFGPIGEGLHSDKEWIDLPSLEKYLQVLKHFLQTLS